MEKPYEIYHRHAALQTVACHGKVNTGNFPGNMRLALNDLYEEGKLIITTDQNGDSWYHLTAVGKQYLMTLNAETVAVTHPSTNA